MDDYHEKLYGQIRESFGKVVYTYTTHIEMANLLRKKDQKLKDWQIFLTSISSVGFWGNIIANKVCLTWVAGITAVISLALNLYSRDRHFTDEIQRNIKSANKLWKIREEYLNLLTDFQILPDETIRERRNTLESAVFEVYNSSPTTNEEAYKLAQKDLKEKEYQFFTHEELDQMLPENLRISNRK